VVLLRHLKPADVFLTGNGRLTNDLVVANVEEAGDKFYSLSFESFLSFYDPLLSTAVNRYQVPPHP
jgi:hypothetical protein